MAFLALATVMHFTGNSNFVAGGIPALQNAPMELLLPMLCWAPGLWRQGGHLPLP